MTGVFRMTLMAGMLGLSTAAALAQPVTLRSGEHGRFTRLVAEIGENRDWQTERDGQRFIIRFSPDAPDFDLSGVFSRIPRTRIRNLDSRGGLTIFLGCDCGVALTRYEDRFLIIDVSEDHEDTETPAPIASAPGSGVELPLFAGTRQVPSQEEGTVPPVALLETDPSPGIDIALAGDILAEELARAAAAGLLTPGDMQSLAAADPAPRNDDDDPSAMDEMLMESDPTDDPSDPPDFLPPLTTSNAFDLNQSSDRYLISPRQTHCPAPPRRAFHDWTEDMSFAHGVGFLRSEAYDDRGQIVPQNAMRLAEFYLAHGFGAEARFWLDHIPGDHVFHHAMIAYLEYDETDRFGMIDLADLCTEEVLFWQFLTASDPPRLSDPVVAALIARYLSMPDGMRDRLGPDLARQFLVADLSGAALEIQENLRLGGRVGPQVTGLLDLEMSRHGPGPEITAPPQAVTPANAGAANANIAMTHYLHLQIETYGRVRPEDLIAAEALILESDPPLTLGGLRHMAAKGHALSGNVYDMLNHLGAASDDDLATIFFDIAETLMREGHTAELILLLTTPEFGQFGHYPNPAARRRVARYFLDQGMPEFARDIVLAGGSDHAGDREILGSALERMSRDRVPPNAVSAPQTLATTPDTIPANAEEISDALSQSQSLRLQISQMLSSSQ